METATKISASLRTYADAEKAILLSRYFKTGPGDYAEGDKFLGIPVPKIRSCVKSLWHHAELDDVDLLTRSVYHEERLAGFFILIELYGKAKKRTPQESFRITDYYLTIIERGNNWDLVDLVAPKILGDHLSGHPEYEVVVMQLASSGNLWKERVSIVATLPLIKKGDFDLIIDLALMFASHPHDLINKATGWMLREVGKINPKTLQGFLDRHCTELSRTTLSYATERLDERRRISYRMQLNEAIRTRNTGVAPAHIPMTKRVSSIKLPKKKDNQKR